MPGPIVTLGASVTCSHVGTATPTAPDPRVTVMGQPIVTMASPYAIAGCTFPAMTGGNSPPCVTAAWTTGAVRVTSMGQPVILQDSQATCTPNGTPLLIVTTQPRVMAM